MDNEEEKIKNTLPVDEAPTGSNQPSDDQTSAENESEMKNEDSLPDSTQSEISSESEAEEEIVLAEPEDSEESNATDNPNETEIIEEEIVEPEPSESGNEEESKKEAEPEKPEELSETEEKAQPEDEQPKDLTETEPNTPTEEDKTFEKTTLEENMVEKSESPTEKPVVPVSILKKQSKGFIFSIFLLTVAFLFSLLVFFFYKPTPETILSSAIDNFQNAENISFVSTSEFVFSEPELSGAKSAKLILSSSSLSVPADASLSINIVTPEDDEIFTNLQAKITVDKKIFINSSNLENFLDDMNLGPVFGTVFGEDFYRELVSGIDKDWWEIDNETFNFLSELQNPEETRDSKEISSCLTEKTKDLSLKNAKFLSVATVKDVDHTFEIHIDSDELTNFVYEPVTCFSEIKKEDLSGNLAAFIGELPKVFVDVDSSNNFSRVYFDDETNEYSLSTIINLDYDNQKIFKTPESYIPFSELLKLYQSTQSPTPQLN